MKTQGCHGPAFFNILLKNHSLNLTYDSHSIFHFPISNGIAWTSSPVSHGH